MTMFHVSWEIDIEAANPREAAEKAWAHMRREDSTANVFSIIEHDKSGEPVQVDLMDVEELNDDSCRSCGAEYDDGGDGFDGLCPSCADQAEENGAEIAARAAGWRHGGDQDGIIYHKDHYGSWKEALSWPDEDKPTYSEWADCCNTEDIEFSPSDETAEENAEQVMKSMGWRKATDDEIALGFLTYQHADGAQSNGDGWIDLWEVRPSTDIG